MPNSSTNRPEITILGAGPAGTSAALFLARDKNAVVTVLERGNVVGGNAGSFLLDGIWCDFGSHRLHAAAEPHILREIQSLLGDSLLWRPRHGRILLQGRWIHFPLELVDLLLRLPKKFALTLLVDLFTKFRRARKIRPDSFATMLERDLGPTMCKSFYFPYVRKLWGIPPDELAVTLAKRRVAGSSLSRIFAKILRRMTGRGKGAGAGFYYPRTGFGAISEALYREASRCGVQFLFGADVRAIVREGDQVMGVRYYQGGEDHFLPARAIWSTIPISLVAKRLEPPPPKNVTAAAEGIRFRSMILIYLVLQQPQFTSYDAHYFPELTVPISRMSEPKNYSAATSPPDHTVLCAELPCSPSDPVWSFSDAELGNKLCDWLAKVNLPVRARVIRTITRRLSYAYPVYERGFEDLFAAIDGYLGGIGGLLTFGRQGLFAHDNTHHAMAMAYAAANCLDSSGNFDRWLWSCYRQEFESHVVED